MKQKRVTVPMIFQRSDSFHIHESASKKCVNVYVNGNFEEGRSKYFYPSAYSAIAVCLYLLLFYFRPLPDCNGFGGRAVCGARVVHARLLAGMQPPPRDGNYSVPRLQL